MLRQETAGYQRTGFCRVLILTDVSANIIRLLIDRPPSIVPLRKWQTIKTSVASGWR